MILVYNRGKQFSLRVANNFIKYNKTRHKIYMDCMEVLQVSRLIVENWVTVKWHGFMQ